MWNLKYGTNENSLVPYDSQKIDMWLPRRRGGRGGKGWSLGVRECKLLYIGWGNNKFLLYRAGDSIQYPVITIMEQGI